MLSTDGGAIVKHIDDVRELPVEPPKLIVSDVVAELVRPLALRRLDSSERDATAGREGHELRSVVRRVPLVGDDAVPFQGISYALDALTCEAPSTGDLGDRTRLRFDRCEHAPASGCLAGWRCERVACDAQEPVESEDVDNELAERVTGRAATRPASLVGSFLLSV